MDAGFAEQLASAGAEDVAAALRENPLRIGISTRALFDLEEEHQVFINRGVQSYAKMQLDREEVPLREGTGFEVVKRLLDLNLPGERPFVEVILLSRNSPDLSLRAFKSIDHHQLHIRTGSFTSGRSLAPFVMAWDIDLFLSKMEDDVKAVVAGGAAAARLGDAPSRCEETPNDEVRFAFDGDAVVFSAESDEIYKNEGLTAFLAHEVENAKRPLSLGPFGKFLHKLSLLRRIFLNEENVSRVRIALVTARNAPAHERVVRTLREWGTPADEVHFVGRCSKAPILKATGAHIFFDDQQQHIVSASNVVACGHVPGPHDPEELIVPAN
ncbi:5'-nucleotidase [Rhodopseudomonas palustris]